MQQREVSFLAVREPPTAQRLRLVLRGGNTNLFTFPQQDLPGDLPVSSRLSVCQSRAGEHLLVSGIRSGGEAVGAREEAGTSLAWELRRLTRRAAFSVAGLPAA